MINLLDTLTIASADSKKEVRFPDADAPCDDEHAFARWLEESCRKRSDAPQEEPSGENEPQDGLAEPDNPEESSTEEMEISADLVLLWNGQHVELIESEEESVEDESGEELEDDLSLASRHQGPTPSMPQTKEDMPTAADALKGEAPPSEAENEGDLSVGMKEGMPVESHETDAPDAQPSDPEQPALEIASDTPVNEVPVELEAKAPASAEVQPAESVASSGGVEMEPAPEPDQVAAPVADTETVSAGAPVAELAESVSAVDGRPEAVPVVVMPVVPPSNDVADARPVEAAASAGEAEPGVMSVSAAEETDLSGQQGESRLAHADAGPLGAPGQEPVEQSGAVSGGGNDFTKAVNESMTRVMDPSALAQNLDRVVLRAVRADDHSIRIELDPPLLGRVVVHCRETGNGLSVEIGVENNAIRSLLMGQEQDLRVTLESQGLQLGRFSVSCRDGDDRANGEHAEQQSGREQQEMRGRTAGSETVEEPVSARRRLGLGARNHWVA